MTPRAFSFNSPHGACPECQGLGAIYRLRSARASCPTNRKSLAGRRDRAVGARATASWCSDALQALSARLRHRSDDAVRQAAEEAARLLLFGAEAREPARSREERAPDPFGAASKGSLPNLRRRYEEGSWAEQEELEPYRALRPCPTCHGERLKPQSLRGAGQGPDDRRVRQPADRRSARRCSTALELTDREAIIAERILREIQRSPAVPQRRRRRLSHARPQRRDAVGRRRAAHPAGDADRREPDRRALRARRAVDRPAPARQPQAARRRWRGCAISATPSSSSSTTRRRSARPTTSSTSVPAPASTAAR